MPNNSLTPRFPLPLPHLSLHLPPPRPLLVISPTNHHPPTDLRITSPGMNADKRTPLELYPCLNDVEWYRSLPSLQHLDVLALDSFEQLHGFGGAIATMSRIILTISTKSPQADQHAQAQANQTSTENQETSQPQPQPQLQPVAQKQKLHLIAKILADAPPILQSYHEVTTYQQILQPLLTDFAGLSEAQYLELLPSKYGEPFTPDLNPSKDDQTTLLRHLLQQETFKSPYLYHGEINHATCGKFLLLGEISDHSSHSGTYFGNTPHNEGRDLPKLTAPFPTLSQYDITMKAMSAIGQLHAKYWNNRFNNIPTYLPSYDWYINKTGKDDYDKFVAFGVDSWKANVEARERQGIRISPYFKSIVEAMCTKSTWENFCKLYHGEHDENCNDESKPTNGKASSHRRPPFSVIHCDFYPANTMISSSPLYTGIHDINPTGENKSEDAGKKTFGVSDARFFCLDFEFTCVSVPAQDVAQWAIAQLSPEILVKHEMDFLRQYYRQLAFYHTLYTNRFTATHKEQEVEADSGSAVQPAQAQPTQPFEELYPFEHFYEDYVMSVTKWVWLICVTTGIQNDDVVKPSWIQFFFNQVEHFLKMHGITPENAPVFRR